MSGLRIQPCHFDSAMRNLSAACAEYLIILRAWLNCNKYGKNLNKNSKKCIFFSADA